MNQDTRRLCGIGLVIAAVAGVATSRPAPTPTPAPTDVVLVGKFTGPTASQDAAAASAMWLEVADEIEWDATQSEPLFATGHALDTFRTRTRELRFRGQRIGDRQPAVQKIAADYLESKLGVDGGPVTPEKRAAWINAYRTLGRAADAAR